MLGLLGAIQRYRSSQEWSKFQLAQLGPKLRLFVLFLGYGFAIFIGLLPKLWLRFTALLGAKLLSLLVDLVVCWVRERQGLELVQLFPSLPCPSNLVNLLYNRIIAISSIHPISKNGHQPSPNGSFMMVYVALWFMDVHGTTC